MYRLLLAVSLFISSATFSQDTIDNRLTGDDTSRHVIDNYQSYSDSLQKEDMDRMNRRSVEFFLQYQKQQKAKQKKQAMLYIGIGIFFLIILFVGLRRKVKK